MGVDAAGLRGDVVGEGVEVGGLDFGCLAVGEDFLDDGVNTEQGGEGLLVGFVLAGFGFLGLIQELEVIEEDLAELFRGGDVERGAGVGLDRFRELVYGLLEVDGYGLEGFQIDGDSLHFHADEDGEEGRFDFEIDFFLATFLEERPEFLGELVGDVGVLGGVFG